MVGLHIKNILFIAIQMQPLGRYLLTEKPWPWEEDRQKWMKLLKRSLIFTAFSELVVTPILLLLDATIQFNVDMDVENAPSFGQMLPHFLVFQIMEDIMFFSSHWMFHTPWLYKYHKIHH